MLSRVLDFFRRDKEKKKLPVTAIVSNPKPNEAPKEKVWNSWITRWRRHRIDRQKSKEVYSGSHEAHPTHCLKPLRRIRPTKVFYSTGGIK